MVQSFIKHVKILCFERAIDVAYVTKFNPGLEKKSGEFLLLEFSMVRKSNAQKQREFRERKKLTGNSWKRKDYVRKSIIYQ